MIGRAKDRRTQVVALALALGAILVPGTASAAVSCGDTVNTDVKLKKSLDCSTEIGLIVGADNVTIDLNGHAITGPGTTPSIDSTGIGSNGYDGTTIKNGVVGAFGLQVSLANGSRGTVSNVNVAGNNSRTGYGIDFRGMRKSKVTKSTVENLEYAISSEAGGSNSISKSSIFLSTYGLYLRDEKNTNVSRVNVNMGSTGGEVGAWAIEMRKSKLSRVKVKGSGYEQGFYIDQPFGVTIDKGSGTGALDSGIAIKQNDPNVGHSASVTNSRFTGNESWGIFADFKGTKTKNNTVRGNGTNCFNVKC